MSALNLILRRTTGFSNSLRAFSTVPAEPRPNNSASKHQFQKQQDQVTNEKHSAESTSSQKDISSQRRLSRVQYKKISRHLDSLLPEYEKIGATPPQTRQRSQIHSNSVSFNPQDQLTISQLISANVHLGHSEDLWNPVNLNTIFGLRNGIHIINLEHTLAALRRCANLIRQVAYNGGIILFVGTKEMNRKITIEAAFQSEQYYVVDKWYAGTLTNGVQRLMKQTTYIKDVYDVPEAVNLLENEQDKVKDKSAPKSRYDRYRESLEEKANKDEVEVYKPDLIVALNPVDLKTMLAETVRTNIPTVGIVDTNCDPRTVTYSIPANDDSVASVRLIASYLSSAALAGKIARKHKINQLSLKKAKKESEKIQSDDKTQAHE